MTLIRGHGNCIIDLSNTINLNFQIKFHKSNIKTSLIVNFIRENVTLIFAHKSKSKIILNIHRQKRIMKHKILQK